MYNNNLYSRNVLCSLHTIAQFSAQNLIAAQTFQKPTVFPLWRSRSCLVLQGLRITCEIGAMWSLIYSELCSYLYRRENGASRSWSGAPATPPSPLPCFLFTHLLSSPAVHTHGPHHTSQKRKTWWYSRYCPVCCPFQCTLIHLGEKKPFHIKIH